MERESKYYKWNNERNVHYHCLCYRTVLQVSLIDISGKAGLQNQYDGCSIRVQRKL